MKEKKELITHIIIIAIIVLIFAFAIFKLVRWNSNTNKELPGVETDENFDTDPEDYITMVNPMYLEGRKDDGVHTILMMGDDTLSKYSGSDGIVQKLAGFMDASILDCSFSNTYVAARNADLQTADADDMFSFYWLAQAISSKDYTPLDNAVSKAMYSDSNYKKALETLKSTDFDKVDTLAVLYGPHDYLDSHLITDVNDENSPLSYTGAIKASVEAIQAAYPHIRIVLISPTFCLAPQEDGTLAGSDIVNTGYGTLADYMVGAKNIAVMTNATYIDNYYGIPLNENTYKQYLEKDIYPNAKAREMIAERIAKLLSK